MKETTSALGNILVWVVCRLAFFLFFSFFLPFFLVNLLMFHLKRKRRKAFGRSIFVKLLIHKAHGVFSLEY